MSQTSNSKSTCLFFQKLKNKKQNKEIKTNQQTHPKKHKTTWWIPAKKPPSVNSVLEQLHSPTHISSEGLLQYSIGN